MNSEKKFLSNLRANALGTILIFTIGIISNLVSFRIIGAEGWGLVGICLTTQIIFNLLESGLSQLLPRDMVQSKYDQSTIYVGYLIYAVIVALVGAGLIISTSTYLVTGWFDVPKDKISNAELLIKVAAVQGAFVFMNAINYGYYAGLGDHRFLNKIQAGFAFTKNAALVLVIWLCKSAESYIWTLAIYTAIEFAYNHQNIRKEITQRGLTFSISAGFDFIKSKKNEFASFLMVSSIAVVLTQIDRIILSNYLSLSNFGVYTVLVSIGSALYLVQQPIFKSSLPFFVNNITEKTVSNLQRKVAILVALPLSAFIVIAPTILSGWLPKNSISDYEILTLRMFGAAVLINAFYNIYHQIFIITGRHKIILKLNILFLAALVLLAQIIPIELGVLVGGCLWVALALMQIISGWFICKNIRYES